MLKSLLPHHPKAAPSGYLISPTTAALITEKKTNAVCFQMPVHFGIQAPSCQVLVLYNFPATAQINMCSYNLHLLHVLLCQNILWQIPPVYYFSTLGVKNKIMKKKFRSKTQIAHKMCIKLNLLIVEQTRYASPASVCEVSYH